MLVSNLSAALAARGVTNRVIALCDAATLGNTIEMEAILAEQIRNGGSDFVSLRLSKKRGPLEGAAALRKLLASSVPDVIHCHTARAVAMVALSGFRGSVILTHHNTRLSFPGYLFRAFDLVVDRYVAISPELEAIYRSLTRRPITLIPNAAAREFDAGAPRTAAGKPCLILSVGTISDQKNYGLVLETAAAMRDSNPEFARPKFLIAGGGQGLDELRMRSQDMGLFEDVEFLGERSDVRHLMASADILLNTSTYEGLPIAIIEAMGMALPIVATDVAGNRDLVAEGENGLLAPLDDPAGLAAAIGRVIVDADLYRSLSQGAVKKSGQFSIDVSADRHLALYRSAGR
ncbi:glycosyltransferase family 4 protein [Altererythrobacter sp. Root672]|uniref:glycosyltransferase family 4 protein n=1 Tax=Altererythrobacter sp. Root672 TaxID=1736584 RepID=UPI00138F17EE